MKYTIRFEPHGQSVEVKAGTTFLAAALMAKIPVQHKCGGKGTCGTCKVQIQSESPLPTPGHREKMKFSNHMLKEGHRLSCQCKVTGHAKVIITEDPLKRVVRLQLEAMRGGKEDR